MPYIVSPIYGFFNHYVTLYEIAEPIILINGQMNLPRQLPASEATFFIVDKRAKAASSFIVQDFMLS